MTAQRDALRKEGGPVTCCRTRLGAMKRRYRSPEVAQAEADRLGQAEVYPCENAPGFHVRRKRK